MLDMESARGSPEDVDLRFTGERAEGPHRCAECGYGIAIYAALPRCPMCGGETWECQRAEAGASARV